MTDATLTCCGVRYVSAIKSFYKTCVGGPNGLYCVFDLDF